MKPWKISRTAVALLAVSFALVTTAHSAAQDTAHTLSPQKLQRLGAYLNNEVATGKIPGAVVLVQQHGKPVYAQAIGGRDVCAEASMTTDSIFRLYSMSKPITSVAAMMLVEDGKLR